MDSRAVFPLELRMASPQSTPRWGRYWPAALTLAAGVAATAVLARTLHQRATEADADRFRFEAHVAAQLLEGTMERYEERLARLADYCGEHPDQSASAWRFRLEVTDPAYNLPAVMALAVASRSPVEAGVSVAPGGDASRPESARLSLPVRLAYARQGFPALTNGTDLALAEGWRESLADGLSRPRGWVSAAPQRVVRSDGLVEHGFWFVLPLFRPDQGTAPWRKPREADEERDRRRAAVYAAAATGLLAAFLSTDRLVDHGFNRPEIAPRLHLALHTAREPSSDRLINPETPDPAQPRHREVLIQPWYGRRWALVMTSTPRFEADSGRHRAWLVLQAGGLMSLLAAGLVGVAVRARLRQEGLTAEILQARDALAAAETERVKLGRDLHDGAIQSLSAIQLGLTRSAEQVAAQLPAASAALRHARRGVDEVIAELRRHILGEAASEEQPHPPGFEDVLAAMVRRMQPHTVATIQIDAEPGAGAGLSVAQVVELSQIAASAMANSLRHAQANNIRITLERVQGEVRLTVADDGMGFDPGTVATGMGLPTMRTRAQKAGGWLAVESRPGGGTRTVVGLPVGGVSPKEAPAS